MNYKHSYKYKTRLLKKTISHLLSKDILVGNETLCTLFTNNNDALTKHNHAHTLRQNVQFMFSEKIMLLIYCYHI